MSEEEGNYQVRESAERTAIPPFVEPTGYIPSALQPSQSSDLPGLFLGLPVAGDCGAAPARCKKVLVACESSGEVRDAFIARGHDAWSCDLLPTKKPGPHFTCDVRKVIELGWEWDLMIAHPPCTYLSVSGLHWNKRGRLVDGRPRAELTEEALEFVAWLLGLPIPEIGLENPVGCISSRIRKPDQIIQPWQFGADASKATCLWLKGLPKLRPTQYVEPRIVNGRKRWANQTDSGQNKLPPSADRWELRSATYPGIAIAMASQWG